MNQTTKYDVASHGDYHVFSFKDKFFLYDIENMNAYEIDDELFQQLDGDVDREILSQLTKVLPTSNLPKNQKDSVNAQPLTNISLNVAQVCNLSCVYCYGVDGEYGTKGKMPEGIAFKSVDFLISESKNVTNISITFFGGEPLLNFPLIKKVVDYSRIKAAEANKKIGFSITTNGTKFSDEVNEYLNTNNFSVTVSFDGDEEIQNKNRPFRGGKDSYAQIKPKIEKFLKSRNGNAVARATVTNHSFDLAELRLRLKEMGFKRAGATVATLSKFALDNRDVDGVDEGQFTNLLKSYEIEAQNLKKAIQERQDLSKMRDSKILRYISQLKNKSKSYYSCGVGRSMVGISITGDVYPCHRFVGEEKFKLGNVKDFNTENRASYSKSYVETHPVCSKCWAKYQCGGGGCIQDNEVTMGDVNNINIRHCTQLKYQVKHAIDVFNELDEDERAYLMEHTN